MANLSREYCAIFGEATEAWKQYVIGEVTVAFDEYRDSVCQKLQGAANSGPDVSTGVGPDGNQEEMFSVVLENAQQQAEQRIINALNQTLNQPPVLHNPVVSIIETAQVHPPGETAISQGIASSGQIEDDNDSLDVSIKSEDTDNEEEVQVKEKQIKEEEDITDRCDEQTANNNLCENDDDDDSLDVSIKSEVDSSSESECESDTDDEEESDQFEEQVDMSGMEDNDDQENDEDYLMSDEDSTDNTTDEDEVAGPSTSTGRRSTGQVSKRPTNAKKIEPLSVITKKLKCTVPGCKKAVKNKNAMNRHLLTSHKLKKYRCLVRRCYGKVSTSFPTQGQLNDHRDKVHGSKTRWTCKCAKKFNSYKELCTHYWNYHELGRFACSKDDCSFKPTNTRAKMQNHQYTHREAKYECPFNGCDRSFKQKCNLTIHTLTHTGERPFPCPECDKSFTQKGILTTHLRIHRNDKCFRCTWPQCTYSSSDRGNVLRHIRCVHFKLPQSKRQQAEEGIEDDRDARDFLAKN